MKSWDCQYAHLSGYRYSHERCNGERRVGNLSSPLVVVYECTCPCHGGERDGQELRHYEDHGSEAE